MITYMDPATEIDALVLDARQGSNEAFSQLVRLNHEAVRTYLSRFLSRTDVADDLAQEVFLVAFRQIGEYRGEAAFSHWLMGIARRMGLDFLRREARRKKRDLEASMDRWHSESLEASDKSAEQHEEKLVALRGCMEVLPPNSRQVVNGFYFDDQPIEMIAQQLDKNAGAVRTMLMRIRRALNKCVEDKMRENDR